MVGGNGKLAATSSVGVLAVADLFAGEQLPSRHTAGLVKTPGGSGLLPVLCVGVLLVALGTSAPLFKLRADERSVPTNPVRRERTRPPAMVPRWSRGCCNGDVFRVGGS